MSRSSQRANKTPGKGQRDASSKLVEHRLSVLELAKELGNVAEACRRRGLDRTSFYEWKRRFQTQGFEGLKDLPPIHKSHPMTTPPEVVDRIKDLAFEHPAYGCNRITYICGWPPRARVFWRSDELVGCSHMSGLSMRFMYDRWP